MKKSILLSSKVLLAFQPINASGGVFPSINPKIISHYKFTENKITHKFSMNFKFTSNYQFQQTAYYGISNLKLIVKDKTINKDFYVNPNKMPCSELLNKQFSVADLVKGHKIDILVEYTDAADAVVGVQRNPAGGAVFAPIALTTPSSRVSLLPAPLTVHASGWIVS